MVTIHPSTERSFVIIKPDGVQRSLIGDITKRFERIGLKLVALKLARLDEERVWQHYSKDEEWFLRKGNKIIEDRKEHNLPIEKDALAYGKDIIQVVVDYITAGPVIIMVWQGNQAVGVVQKLVGGTEPTTSDVGTIRGDYAIDSYPLSTIDNRGIRNLIHCSDSPKEAEREIALWLKPEEIIDYKLFQEQVLYDVNWDGIFE